MKTFNLIKIRAGERTGITVHQFFGDSLTDLAMIDQVKKYLRNWLNDYTSLTDEEVNELIYDFVGLMIYDVWSFDLVEEDQTYDVIFNDDSNSSAKGFTKSKQYCLDYISRYNGTDYSYFADYKGGTVSVICNQSQECIYQVIVK